VLELIRSGAGEDLGLPIRWEGSWLYSGQFERSTV